VPAHRAHETVELLKEVTPDFIQQSLWPPNSPDHNPIDYAIWGIIQERVWTREKLQMLKNFASASWTSGNVMISALSTAQ